MTEQMRRDWNERAREDAHFYVAFGRREQDDEEFFSTAEEWSTGLNGNFGDSLRMQIAAPGERSRSGAVPAG